MAPSAYSETVLSTDEQILQRVESCYQKHRSPKSRVLITIAGVPGSGKTTITSGLRRQLEAKYGAHFAVVVAQDGFHYSRRELRELFDYEQAMARRGAPFTFDAAALAKLVHRLKFDRSEPVRVPGFDHAAKDPIADATVVWPECELVLLEGNYLHLKEAPWDEIARLSDDRWLVYTDPQDVRERIVRRHLAAGIAASREEAELRVEQNDMVNGAYVLDHSWPPDIIISK